MSYRREFDLKQKGYLTTIVFMCNSNSIYIIIIINNNDNNNDNEDNVL
jgi:hypothetical protein